MPIVAVVVALRSVPSPVAAVTHLSVRLTLKVGVLAPLFATFSPKFFLLFLLSMHLAAQFALGVTVIPFGVIPPPFLISLCVSPLVLLLALRVAPFVLLSLCIAPLFLLLSCSFPLLSLGIAPLLHLLLTLLTPLAVISTTIAPVSAIFAPVFATLPAPFSAVVIAAAVVLAFFPATALMFLFAPAAAVVLSLTPTAAITLVFTSTTSVLLSVHAADDKYPERKDGQ